MKRKKGFYSISVVAKMFSVHQQTIRMYEKEGLISPKRSEGNTRLFSEEDVDRLEEVIYLTHKLGVNLAGVEMILKLQKKIKRMQDDMNKIFKSAEGEFEMESQLFKDDLKKQAERLVEIKKENRAGLHKNHIDVIAPAPVPVVDAMAKRPQGKRQQLIIKPEVKQDINLGELDDITDIEIDYDKD